MKKIAFFKKITSIFLFFIYFLVFSSKFAVANTAQCGDKYSHCDGAGNYSVPTCNCSSGSSPFYFVNDSDFCNDIYCCGWVKDSECLASDPDATPPEDPPPPNDDDSETLQPAFKPVTKEDLDSLNPLSITESTKKDTFNPGGNFSVAAFTNQALSFIFPLAGLILFVMIVWGGFEMLTGAASKKNLDAGKQRVTAAIVGFLLLFCSYWIIQIVEQITGVNILG